MGNCLFSRNGSTVEDRNPPPAPEAESNGGGGKKSPTYRPPDPVLKPGAEPDGVGTQTKPPGPVPKLGSESGATPAKPPEAVGTRAKSPVKPPEAVGTPAKPPEALGSQTKPPEVVGTQAKTLEAVGIHAKPPESVGTQVKPSETVVKPGNVSEVVGTQEKPPEAQSYSLPMPVEAPSYSLPMPESVSYSLPMPQEAKPYSLPMPQEAKPYSLPMPSEVQSFSLPMPSEAQSYSLPMPPEGQSYSLPMPQFHDKVPETEATKPKEPERPSEVAAQKKPAATMKRQASAGLQADSVLGRKTVNLKDLYSLGSMLGQGQFGTTYICLDKKTGNKFACKSIAKRKLVTQEDVDDVRREIQIMHHLAGHENVIQIMGAYEDAVAVHLVMELCEGGELFDRIIERGHYTERKAAELARVIVGVVLTCHSLGVMHRDLKPENFLFVSQDEEALLKSIDFGLSMFFRPGETFHDVVGSPYYVAPEVLKKRYGPECDVWSAGVIIYILLSGVPPFWDETEQGIFDQVLKGDLDFTSDPWPSISECGKNLVRKMLDRDPSKRPTALEILRHPWIQPDGEAPDTPLDSAVLTRLKQFSRMTKFKKIAIRVIAENLSEDEIAGLKEMFMTIDRDGSGHITLEELKFGLERVGAKIKDSELKGLMEAADIDNSGTIDYGEFVAAMLHLNRVRRDDHLYAAFSYFDKDGSGYITQDEIELACKSFGLQNLQLADMIREVDQDNDGRIDYNEFVALMQDSGLVQRK